MNYIQKFGCAGGILFLTPSMFFTGRLEIVLGLLAWTSFLMGYVAGALWKVRHALHFWWSIAFASVVHVFLLSPYARITQKMNVANSDGKAFMYLGFGLMIAETLTLIFLLKHAAMWLHRRSHSTLQVEPR